MGDVKRNETPTPRDKPMMACGHAANALKGEAPVCVICLCDEQGQPVDLTGRMARCSCGAERPSDKDRLAFFEYRGPGSSFAVEICACGFYRSAHEPEECRKRVRGNQQTVVESGRCAGFTSQGPHEFDSYYCGCRGWD